MLPSTNIIASSRPPLPVPSSKLDSSYLRTRHPAGNNHKLIVDHKSMALTTPSTIAYTSTSEFRNDSPPARLRNIYKRNENHTGTGLTPAVHGLDLPDSTMKRDWLPKGILRSGKSQQSGRRGSQQNTPVLTIDPPPINTSITADRSGTENGTDALNRRSPLLSGNPLAGLIERLRPRSCSDAVSATTDVVAKRKIGFNMGRRQSVDSQVIDAQTPPVSKLLLSQRRVSTPMTTNDIDEEDETWTDLLDDSSLHPARRKRSTSDSARFLIMRKTSRPNTTEVMGSINRNEVAFKQLLEKFTCYDLMPTKGSLVAIDSYISTRQALIGLAENGVRASLVWDSRQEVPLCLLTVTDFLRIIYTHFFTTTDEMKPHTQADLSDVLERPILSNLIHARQIQSPRAPRPCKLITATGDDKLLSALKILRLNRLHRIPIVEPETGNPLYFLSLKRLLQFLHTHLNNLPKSTIMYKSLDELRVGTWLETELSSPMPSTIISLSINDSLLAAVGKFLRSGASSLPVLQTESSGDPKGPKCSMNDPGKSKLPRIRLINALTKVDLMHFVLVNGWKNLQETKVQDVLKQRNKCMEQMSTCHAKTPLQLAIDRLMSSQAHRLYIVDSDGSLQGVLSIGDLMSYLSQEMVENNNGPTRK